MSRPPWGEFGCRPETRRYRSFACLWKAEWVQPRKPVGKKRTGPQVQRWIFVCIGRCKMEKQIPWLHNWAAIWMSFPFWLCVLTMAIQGQGGNTCHSANRGLFFLFFFFFLFHSKHCGASPSLAMTLKRLKNRNKKNNLIWQLSVPVKGASSPSEPMCLLCVNTERSHRLPVTGARPLGDTCPVQHCRCLLDQQCAAGSADEPRGTLGVVST